MEAMESYKLKYKKVVNIVPFCPICDNQLNGDNSMIFPYKCKCGTWKSSGDDTTKWILTSNQ